MKKHLNSLLNLTAFEFDRISKFLYALIGITLVSNFIGYISAPSIYVSRVNEFMQNEAATSQQALEMFGRFSFYDTLTTVWLIAPVALGISGLLIYSMFIWYREWLGKNTFAYRLLMLPIPRMHIFYSKLIIIFLSIFSLIAVQTISLFIGFQIVSAVVPGEWIGNITFMHSLEAHPYFSFILPVSLTNFISILGSGFVFILVLFTVILMEKSFSIKGIAGGVAYAIFCLITVIFPMILSDVVQNNYLFYDSELIGMIITLMILISVLSLFISRYLLNKKITI